VAYVGALQARLDSERSRKRCACGGVGTPSQVHLEIPRCTWCGAFLWGSPGAPGDLQVHLAGGTNTTTVAPFATTFGAKARL
jgi:hypothetical protein